jgi:hypothetical protein
MNSKCKNNKNETKEDFCGACMTIPFAFAGAGVAGMGAKNKKGSHKKYKNYMLWGGILVTLISIIIGVYYYNTCKQCIE